MAIPTSLLLLTCVGCNSSSESPPQLLAEVPQMGAPSILDIPALEVAQNHAAAAAVPDEAMAVEWSARSREADSATVLKRGSQGDVVARLQARLVRLGYGLSKIDGIFGPETQAVVIQFQLANGLIASGVVDGKSWTKLNAEITQSGVVSWSKASRVQVVRPEPAILSSPPELSLAYRPALTVSTPSPPVSSRKNGWIVAVVILQGAGWLVILVGLNKELVVMTGRSLFPGKAKQWIFSARQ